MSAYFNSYGGNWWQRIPPVTRNIILINVLIWLVEVISGSFGNRLLDLFGLHFIGNWKDSEFNPFQLVSYMFLHDRHTVLHILFNMFTLYMFGRIIEEVWGPKRFLTYYLVCGIGAAIVQEGVWALTWHHDFVQAIVSRTGMLPGVVEQQLSLNPEVYASVITGFKNSMLTVGASGAVFGLLLAFALMFPDMPLYLFFIPVPIKAKYMVLGYAVIEFFLGVSGNMGTIAHFAHLGGMLFGIGLILWWRLNPFKNDDSPSKFKNPFK